MATGIRPALWDLLAKVYAQQGRYLDAESCWREALALAPGTLEYMQGMQAIARERGRSMLGSLLKWLFLAVLFATAGYLGTAIPS